jgi:hypothetical protein
MRSASELREAGARAGLVLEELAPLVLPGGQSTLAGRFTFEDPWAAADLLADLSEEDASDPAVRAWALALLRAAALASGYAMGGPAIPPALADAFLRTVHANVQGQIRFVREKRETFQAAPVTMALGAGDCDDHARLVHALVRSVLLPSRLYFYAKDEQPVHVVARVGLPRQWAETTIPAEFGEEPFAAYRRLVAAGLLEPDRSEDLDA